MKKTISKLALNRETVKTLVDTDLSRVNGGVPPTPCTPFTRLISGCVTELDAGAPQHRR